MALRPSPSFKLLQSGRIMGKGDHLKLLRAPMSLTSSVVTRVFLWVPFLLVLAFPLLRMKTQPDSIYHYHYLMILKMRIALLAALSHSHA